jgi:hypothetical protein
MARGAAAVRAIAEKAPLRVSTVDRVFRTLQAPKDDHAPVGKLGGGKDTPHMLIPHLRNLTVGITAQPLTSAVQWVDQVCALQLSMIVKTTGRATSPFPTPDEELEAVFPSEGETLIPEVRIASDLGQCLNLLILQAAEPGGKQRTARVSVQLTLDERLPTARVSAVDSSGTRFTALFVPKEGSAALSSRPYSDAGLVRTATINASLLHVLADLWNDTLAHQAASTPLSGSDTDVPASTPLERESAAPSRQGEAAPSGDQPWTDTATAAPRTQDRGLDNPDPAMCARVRAIPESSPAGRSPAEPSAPRRRPYAVRHDYEPAGCA